MANGERLYVCLKKRIGSERINRETAIQRCRYGMYTCQPSTRCDQACACKVSTISLSKLRYQLGQNGSDRVDAPSNWFRCSKLINSMAVQPPKLCPAIWIGCYIASNPSLPASGFTNLLVPLRELAFIRAAIPVMTMTQRMLSTIIYCSTLDLIKYFTGAIMSRSNTGRLRENDSPLLVCTQMKPVRFVTFNRCKESWYQYDRNHWKPGDCAAVVNKGVRTRLLCK